MGKNVLPTMECRAAANDADAKEWVEKFRKLGERLGFHIDPPQG
jgi:hypothetical protein